MALNSSLVDYMDSKQRAQLDLQDIALIKKGGAARERGISNLFKRYYQLFYQYYRKEGFNEANAEDLVQEVFVKVIKNIGTFKASCSLSSWMYVIVKNTGYSKYRKKTETLVDDETLEFLVGSTEACGDNEQLIDCVKEGFNSYAKKNNERAQLLSLVVSNGWSTADAALFLERTLGATREYLSQCRKKLKPFIAHCQEI